MSHHKPPESQSLPNWLKDNRETQHKRGEVALSKAAGWKLHLNFDSDNQSTKVLVDTYLNELKKAGVIVTYKLGQNSGQVGKEATVYVGARDSAQQVAEIIEAELGHVLAEPEGDTLKDDAPLTPKIMGRFDIGRADPDFAQYGASGHPLLKNDVASKLWNPDFSQEEASRRAQATLEERYGEFFTGKD